jgi:hypothetical protein
MNWHHEYRAEQHFDNLVRFLRQDRDLTATLGFTPDHNQIIISFKRAFLDFGYRFAVLRENLDVHPLSHKGMLRPPHRFQQWDLIPLQLSDTKDSHLGLGGCRDLQTELDRAFGSFSSFRAKKNSHRVRAGWIDINPE